MKPVFADTFFFLAAINPSDKCHDRAIAWSDAYDGPLLTTVWVITEVADALAGLRHRRVFKTFYETLVQDQRVRIVPPGLSLWERGLELYLKRPDKEWSLTNCLSFVAMSDEGLIEALIGDHHFAQVGFTPLLRSTDA